MEKVYSRSKAQNASYGIGVSDSQTKVIPSQFISSLDKSISSRTTEINHFSCSEGSTGILLHGRTALLEKEEYPLEKQISSNSTTSNISTLTTGDGMMEENPTVREYCLARESFSEPTHDTMALERTNKSDLHPVQSKNDVRSTFYRQHPSLLDPGYNGPSLPYMTDRSFSDDYINLVVRHLNEQKVNFLAIDFDQTMVDIHTGGRWPGKATDLATRLRPSFLKLIPKVIEADFYVAVVTFSPQTRMIADVLHCAFPNHVDRICIRGCDGTWRYEGGGSSEGKQAHMASAVEELRHRFQADITRGSTVLIDDDTNNIRTALSEGVRAVWLDPDNANELPEKLLQVGKVSP